MSRGAGNYLFECHRVRARCADLAIQRGLLDGRTHPNLCRATDNYLTRFFDFAIGRRSRMPQITLNMRRWGFDEQRAGEIERIVLEVLCEHAARMEAALGEWKRGPLATKEAA